MVIDGADAYVSHSYKPVTSETGAGSIDVEKYMANTKRSNNGVYDFNGQYCNTNGPREALIENIRREITALQNLFCDDDGTSDYGQNGLTSAYTPSQGNAKYAYANAQRVVNDFDVYAADGAFAVRR